MNPVIRIKTPERTFRVKLGRGGAVVTAGLGGWTEIPRPDGRPITEWVGAEALKVDVPIMLNGWPRESVERDKDRIFKLGRKGDGEKQPPSFKVYGPVFFSGTRMVLDGTPDIDGESLIRNGNGKLLRLAMTLHLMEFVRGDQIRISKRKKSRYTYKTRKGDTLRSIAKDLFGDVRLAKDLAKANDIRDVRKELKPGTVLTIPPDLPGLK